MNHANHSPSRRRMPAPTRLPSPHDAERAAWAAGWWHGKVVGICLGMALAVLIGWAR